MINQNVITTKFSLIGLLVVTLGALSTITHAQPICTPNQSPQILPKLPSHNPHQI